MKASFGQNEEVQAMVKREEELLRFKLLFKDSLFFLNREVPKKLLEYIIVGFGGKFTTDEEKKGVTHQVMDRAVKQAKSDREYVIPQWIADSINNQVLLPVKKYLSGETAPPHLSPFVDNSKEGYIPTRQKEINEYRGIDERPVDFKILRQEQGDDMEDDEEDNQIIELNDTDEEEDSDSEAEEEAPKGKKGSKSAPKREQKTKAIKKAVEKSKQEDKGDKDLGKMMMGKKARRMFNRQQYSVSKK